MCSSPFQGEEPWDAIVRRGVEMDVESKPQRMRSTSAEIDRAARQLRSRPTNAEAVLWGALRGRKLEGLKFRRQHPIGPFVVDFYCPAVKLVVEVDGGIHEDQKEHDAARAAHLRRLGHRVVRVRNQDVVQDLAGVLDLIRRTAAGTGPA